MNELKSWNQKTPSERVFGKASCASLEGNTWAEMKHRTQHPEGQWHSHHCAAPCCGLLSITLQAPPRSMYFLVEAWMGGD